MKITMAGELIDALGGTRQVAEWFEVRDNTVSMWRHRGFPPWTYTKLWAEIGRKRLHVDDALLESKRPQRAAPASQVVNTQPKVNSGGRQKPAVAGGKPDQRSAPR